MAKLRNILGTMLFGGALNEAQSHQMLKEWVKNGNHEIDAGIMYQHGNTEKIIGKLHLCRDSKKVHIACKAYPGKGFTTDSIVNQLNTSLESLQVSSVDIFYLHFPDHNIPIEDTLKGVNQLYVEGKFKEFGLSNYASWEVVDIYHICKANGYVLPTVYQGMYNPLTRDIELELIPALRRLGMRFYVYNPLAGGLLSGKYDFSKDDAEQPKGRFFASNRKTDLINSWVKTYQNRFWQDCYKDGVEHVAKTLDDTYKGEVTIIEATFRWLKFHSKLADNDGIILGASKLEHLNANMKALNSNEPLHDDLIQAFDNAWDGIRSHCPKYNR